jgi:hypothetical protein
LTRGSSYTYSDGIYAIGANSAYLLPKCGPISTTRNKSALLLVPLAHRLCDGGTLHPRLARVAGTFSRHSLTIYLLHHVVHVWPLWIWGAATADDVTVHWQRAMPAAASLCLAAAFLVAAYPLLRWLDASGRRGIEGWMRWLCD